MRVIAGEARGHRLIAPKSAATRPVLDQVKEAMFNILFDVRAAHVLDLFAGSGAVGIEALSRGAAHCTFVEQARVAVAAITQNLKHCRLDDRATVIAAPVFSTLKKLARRDQSFDLIFVDPPYERDLVNRALSLLANSPLVTAATRIVVEHHPKELIQERVGLRLTDQRKYGQTRVSFLVTI